MIWGAPHRLAALGFGLALVLAMTVAGFWFFVIRSTGTPLDLRQALQIYRQGQGTGRSGASGKLPPPGVYRYRTKGSEHLSIGIGRTYPVITSMVVTNGTCTSMDWMPLEEHTEGLVACPERGGGLTITSTSSTEVIAGITTNTLITCPSTVYLLPPNPTTGERWSATCRSNGHPVELSGEIVGPATVDMAGRRIPALHTRLVFTFSGPERGTNPNNFWLDAKDGVILQEVETADIAQQAGPFGSIHYDEALTIALQSMTPLR